jgi:hypothetical protein
MDEQGRNDVERLNWLWDAALNPAPVGRDGELAEAIAALHAVDDAPEPDPLFLARLRSELLVEPEPATARMPRGAQPIGLVWPAPAILPPRSFARLAIAAIAAALLIAALSGGGRWLAGSDPAPMTASAMASNVPDPPTVVPPTIESLIGNQKRASSARFYPTVVPGLAIGAPSDVAGHGTPG